jgi:hypothetical protein
VLIGKFARWDCYIDWMQLLEPKELCSSCIYTSVANRLFSDAPRQLLIYKCTYPVKLQFIASEVCRHHNESVAPEHHNWYWSRVSCRTISFTQSWCTNERLKFEFLLSSVTYTIGVEARSVIPELIFAGLCWSTARVASAAAVKHRK